jgi:hypothetical protein
VASKSLVKCQVSEAVGDVVGELRSVCDMVSNVRVSMSPAARGFTFLL